MSGPSDGFLAEILTTFFEITSIRSWLIGGSGEDKVTAVAAFRFLTPFTPNPTYIGVAVAGTTASPDLPVRSAAQANLTGETDMFVGFWNQNRFDWLTYLGGSGVDEATGVAQNLFDDVFVSGWTRSTNWKTVDALQPQSGGGEDGVFAVLNPTGVRHLTYFGGSGDDRANSVVLIASGVARIGGETTSPDLPSRLPIQLGRGGQRDGFVAEIGPSFLTGPREVIVPKDGAVSLMLRLAQTAALPITYRSADPSKVRLSDRYTSGAEVTVVSDASISVEALTDAGEVAITATAPGMVPQVVMVKLYPGAVVPFVPFRKLSTWASGLGVGAVGAYWWAIDPATGKPVGSIAAFRSGIHFPPVRWTSSNEQVLKVMVDRSDIFGQTSVTPVGPGEARLRLESSWPVWEGDPVVVTVERPTLPTLPAMRLGKDLQRAILLPLALTSSETARGTLTVRSDDPSRVLVSADSTTPGSETASVEMRPRERLDIWVRALSDEGEARVRISSPELAEEAVVTVQLERTVLEWGVPSFESGVRTLAKSVSVRAGVETNVVFVFRSESGSEGSLRAGIDDYRVRLANSAPAIVEMNKVSAKLAPPEGFTLRGLAGGRATLTLLATPEVRLANSSINVDITQQVTTVIDLPPEILVGKDLQARIAFRLDSAGDIAVDVSSDDPSGAVVSGQASTAGTRQVTLRPRSGSYELWVQGLRETRETTLRLRFPFGERRIRVMLLPSGVGFSTTGRRSLVPGFDEETDLFSAVLDEISGVPLLGQTVRPGQSVSVALRSEGSPIRFTPPSVVFNSTLTQVTVNLALPAAGEQATLIAASNGRETVLPIQRRLAQFFRTGPTELVQDTIMPLRLGWDGTTPLPTPETTVRSLNPAGMLVSLAPDEPGVASVSISRGSETPIVYLHGLSATGTATLRLERAGAETAEMLFRLAPLRGAIELNNYGNITSARITAGAPVSGKVRLNVFSSETRFRPGVLPLRLRIRATDAAVVSVTPASLEIANTDGAPFTVTGRASGDANLIVEGDRPLLAPLPMALRVDGDSNSAVVTYELSLGGNLQTNVPVQLDRPNPGGVIATVTSSDASRLLVSRSGSVLGSGSVAIAVPAGQQQSSPGVFLQALSGEGEVTVTMRAEGFGERRVVVRLVPSWFTPGIGSRSVALGNTISLQPVIQQGAIWSQTLQLRPGLGDLTLRIVASPRGVVESPEALVVTADQPFPSANLLALSLGETALRFEQPPGFGPAPEGDGARLRVELKSLEFTCPKPVILGRDTQVACSIGARGVSVEVLSSDPQRLLLAVDSRTVGTGRQVLAVTDRSTLTLQALASDGTVEIVLTAPGYEELRVPVILRPTEIRVVSGSQGTVRPGSSVSWILRMHSPDLQPAVARQGASVRVGLSIAPAGIASIDPATIIFGSLEGEKTFNIRGVAAGSALVRIAVPEGFTNSLPPTPITVQ